MNLMSDARAADAGRAGRRTPRRNHLQIAGTLSAAQIARIIEFERQVYIAQVARTRRRQPGRARRPAGLRAAQSRRGRRRRARQQHHALCLSDGRQVDAPAADDRRDGERAQRVARVHRARPRRVHVPHVLDQGLDAPQLGGPRQSRQADLRHLPRHAHDRAWTRRTAGWTSARPTCRGPRKCR